MSHTYRTADSVLVSVIMPVYNGQLYLAEAIRSVLAQRYRPIEVIVVDDGSTDESAEVVKQFDSPIRYFYQANKGLGAALNQGIVLAHGDFFAFLDADDLWGEDKLSLQMGALHSQPETDMVFGHVACFISPELEERVKRILQLPAEPMPGYCKGAMLIRRDAFYRVGPFATTWQLGDFVDWFLRAREQGLQSLMLPQVVLRRRIHKNNQGIRDRDYQRDYVRIVKAALDRRRQKER